MLDSLHEQMNTAKCVKNCQAPLSTTTANSFNSVENANRTALPLVTAITDSSCDPETLEMYECLSPECPNSPNVTMAGSPRGEEVVDTERLEYRNAIFVSRLETFQTTRPVYITCALAQSYIYIYIF